MMPRPDLVVLLDGDDRNIWERKQESPYAVHQTTQARYRAMIAGLSVETAVVRTYGARADSVQRLKQALANSSAIRRKLYRA
jgi:hypothetical protein